MIQKVPSAEEDHLHLVFRTKAEQVLPPVALDLIDALEVEDDPALVEAVGHALARAFMDGAAVGATEMVAQASR